MGILRWQTGQNLIYTVSFDSRRGLPESNCDSGDE